MRASSTGGVTQTKKSFTGQYRDDTGLSYYNARYYDPGTGRFVSADTISPGKDNPQNRNRYSYALNNPIFYTDPSGHCVEGYETTVAGCKQYLADHAWKDFQGDWKYNELFLFVSSIQDMKQAFGWLRSDYISAMTGGGEYTLRASIFDEKPGEPGATGFTSKEGSKITMNIYRKGAFRSSSVTRAVTSIKGTFVHEQAHVWDFASGDKLSDGLKAVVGGHTSTTTGLYTTYDAFPSTSNNTKYEDFAETVMLLVYPGHPRAAIPISDWGDKRKAYMRSILPHTRIP